MDTQQQQHSQPRLVHARRQRGSVSGAYVDPEYVFQYCEAGEADFRLESRSYRIGPGCAMLMPPHLPHAIRPTSDRGEQYVVIHLALPPEAGLLQAFPLVVQFTEAEAQRVSGRCDELLAEWQTRAAGWELIAGGILSEILGRYWRSRAAGPTPVETPSKAWRNVESAIAWMHENHRRPMTIPQLSQFAGLSPAYFCKAFKEYTGRSPHHYLNGIRIEKARQLLCDSELNCTEVGRLVGFPNVAIFSKVFRQHAGRSPSQWVDDYLSQIRRHAE